MIRRLFSLLSFLLLMTTAVSALEPGDQAPTFALRTLDDDYFFLRDLCGKELRRTGVEAKVVVLDFWAVWCEPCHRILPIVRETVSSYDTSKVALVVISEDLLSVRDRLAPKLGDSIPLEIRVLDPYHVVMEKYEIMKIPATFVLSPSGEIADILGHDRSEEAIERWLRQAIERGLKE